MSSFAPLARAFAERGVRYVLIGVSGANMHAHLAGVVFSTLDRDVFLPPEPRNLLEAWRACEACGLQLSSSGEPRRPIALGWDTEPGSSPNERANAP